MSAAMRPPPDAVPTLTEVVGFGESPPAPDPVFPGDMDPVADVAPLRAVSFGEPVVPVVGLSPDAAPVARSAAAYGDIALDFDEEQLAHRVLLDVQRQVDRMFEYRAREAVGPVFARLLDAFLRDTHEELNLTLRDVVRRAVAQELAKHRAR